MPFITSIDVTSRCDACGLEDESGSFISESEAKKYFEDRGWYITSSKCYCADCIHDLVISKTANPEECRQYLKNMAKSGGNQQ